MSSKPLGNTSLTSFDTLVIGSGAGGAPVISVLCAQGKKVLVLEAGANRFEALDDGSRAPISRFANDELGISQRGLIAQNILVEPRTFRATEKDVATIADVNALPKTVGGG